MKKNNEFEILQLKMESLQERIELKQDELADLVADYMKAYAKYIEMAADMFSVEDYEEEDEYCDDKYHSCLNCRYGELDGDDHPCFTCKSSSNWKAE